MRKHVPFSIPIAMERWCLTSSVFDTQGIHTATFGRLCLPLPRPTHMCYVTLLAHIAAIPQSTKKTERSYFLDCDVKSANVVNFNQVSQQWNLHNNGLCNIFVLVEPAMGFPSHNGFFHLFHTMTFGNDSYFTMQVQKLIAISNFGLCFCCCYICIDLQNETETFHLHGDKQPWLHDLINFGNI